ncbi:MAG: hypothetical protein J6V66_00700 [Clostridia bacterium]|nr:hypothetical protein [Clostridia bacterium]
MNEFEQITNSLGTAEDIKGLMLFVKDKEKQNKVIDFIKKNKIDCNHLWEDGEEGDKATENWHKLVEFVLPLIPDNG